MKSGRRVRFRDMELNRIYNENCLDTLARMPDGFLQCVVTSPPYYGLRSYKTEPQIWDGDAKCQHVWGDEIRFSKQDARSAEQKREQGAAVGGSITFNDVTTTGNSGNFCKRCNSWRGELGLEPTFQLYISHLLQIFAEVKRVLKPDGTVFVNLGDSFAGSGKGIGDKNGSHGKSVFTDDHISKTDWSQISVRAKSLMNIPHRFFIGMTDELQMIQRNNINWWKRACMPSSAMDRWTVDFESIGFFSKNAKYKFNQQLEDVSLSYAKDKRAPGILRQKFYPNSKYVKEGMVELNEGEFPRSKRTAENGMGSGELGNSVRFGDDPNGKRNARTTWDIGYEPSTEAHFASYPTKLVERMILAGTDESDIVYDPFAGTNTTAVATAKLGRNFIGSELQPKYWRIGEDRLAPIRSQATLF